MLKLDKEQKKMADLTIRPFFIFAIAIIVITYIGDYYGTLSEAEIDGIIKTFMLNFLIVYMNAAWIETEEKIKKDKEKEDASTDVI